MPDKRLGLDVGDDAVSAVMVKGGLKADTVVAWARVPVDPETGAQAAVAVAIEAIRGQAGLDQTVVSASFADNGISFRRLSVPFTEPRKIRQVLPFELEEGLPFRVEEIVADYHVIQKDDQTDILAAVTNVPSVAGRLEMLEEQGLAVENLTVAGFCAALSFLSAEDAVPDGMLVCLGQKSADLFFFQDRKVVQVRHLSGDFRREPEKLSQNILFTMKAFGEESGQPFDSGALYLSGVGSSDPELARNLEQNLGLGVKPLDLRGATNTLLAPEVTESWDPALLNGALALALFQPTENRGVNLRQGPFALRKRFQEYREYVVHAGVLAAILFLAYAFGFFAQTHLLAKKAANLERQVAVAFHSVLPETRMGKQPVFQVRERMEEMKKAPALPVDFSNVKVVDMLQAVSANIGRNTDVRFTNFTATTEGVQITGETDNISSVDAISEALSKADLFQKVTIVSTDIDNRSGKVRFRIKGTLAK